MRRPLSLPPRYVVLDTETTGMHAADGHSIVEVAAQKIAGREVIGEFVELINPGHAMDPGAMQVHGITEIELIARGQPPQAVLSRLFNFIGDWPIIAHNVGFDLSFLNEHCRRLQLPLLKNSCIDSVALARQSLILSSYSLRSVARFLKIDQPQAHRALADVITLRDVLFRLADRAAVR